MAGITVTVHGYPPAKSEAKSVLTNPRCAQSVRQLLQAVHDEVGAVHYPVYSTERLGMEVTLTSDRKQPSDATNLLGGIADVLQDKSRRTDLSHLDRLQSVALFRNDEQLHELCYRFTHGDPEEYRVRVWVLRP
jgi:hypothetical protein